VNPLLYNITIPNKTTDISQWKSRRESLVAKVPRRQKIQETKSSTKLQYNHMGSTTTVSVVKQNTVSTVIQSAAVHEDTGKGMLRVSFNSSNVVYTHPVTSNPEILAPFVRL
jgi:hypothetical protein